MARVIIADDEEFVRYYLRSTLEDFHFQVQAEANSGTELLKLMKESPPDILLLDINMPDVDGIEFLKNYAEQFPFTCIIMLTSVTNEKLIEECEKLGARNFLRKDLEITELIDNIETTWDEFKEEQW